MPYRAQTILPYYTNVPADVVSNNFSFIWDGPGDPITTDYQDLVTAIAAFYEAAYASASSAANYVDWTKFQVRIYNLDLPSPSPPVHIQTTALTVSLDTSSNLPAETAVVCSFQGDPVPGINQARRRGRIYLGALGDSFITVGSSSAVPRVNTTKATALAAAMDTFLTDVNTTTNFTWIVWSPTAAQHAEVTNGWVDLSWDTQRRRGLTEPSRQLWP